MTNILKNGYKRKSRSVIKTRTSKSRPRKSRVYSRKYKKQSRMRMDMKRLKNMFKSIAKKIKKSMSRKMRHKKPEHKQHPNLKERYSKELFKNQQFIAEEEDKLVNLLAQYKKTKNKDLIKDIDHTKINIIKLGHQIDRLDKNLKRYRTNELLERRILKNKIIEE